jgi:hypothetical protein
MEAVVKMRRLLASRPQRAGEQCGFCGTPEGDAHRHVVDREHHRLMCVCRACYLLFADPGAAAGRYGAVPDRYLRVTEPALTDAQWNELGIPVGIAFFFRNSSDNRVLAFYPSPAGAAEAEVSASAWEEIEAANPVLESLAPDVEALLVCRLRGQSQSYIVPVDACYELVGRVRQHWHGFDGGEEAWREIEGFFASVERKAA